MKKITWILLTVLLKFYVIMQKIQNFFLSIGKKQKPQKIFCIGVPKTGTTSLHKALKILGYKSVKMYDWTSYWKKGEDKYIDMIKKSYFEVYSDYPFGMNIYKKIDREIPNSKFILTIRDSKALKKSYINFYENSPFSEYIINNLEEILKNTKERDKEINDYFKDKKSQLLIMDILNGDKWDKLCSFLNKPIPKKPFPHKNKQIYRDKKNK